jgi:hypothetical protein
MTISDSINGIEFYDLLGIDCSKIVKQRSEDRLSGGENHIVRDLLKIVFSLFFDQYGYILEDFSDKCNTVFILDRTTLSRPDEIDLMKKVYSCASDSSCMMVRKKLVHPRYFCIKKVFHNIYRLYKWIVSLRKSSLSWKDKYLVLGILSQACNQCAELRNFSMFKNVVVLFDGGELDNVTSQFYKTIGKTTITLQHGIMVSRKGRENVPYMGIWFYNFVSDYFLAWNDFTLQEAIKDSFDVSKMRVCGIARCIDYQPLPPVHNKIMGVLLDGETLHNFDLIKVANLFCAKYGYKYVLKYHPSFEGNEYDDIVDNTYFIEINKDMIADYAQKVEFTIQGISTALLEFLCLGHKTYVCSTGLQKDIYHQFIPTFKDLPGLERLMKMKDYGNEAFDSLITVKDIRKAYTDFFANL